MHLINLIEHYKMNWVFTLAKSFGELIFSTLSVYCLYMIIFYLSEYLNSTLPRNRNISIVMDKESMCDHCKKKDRESKRLFKGCNHVYCSRCFLGRCTHLCQCMDCRSTHFKCYICNRTRIL